MNTDNLNQILNISIIIFPIILVFLFLFFKKNQKVFIKSNKPSKTWERLIAFILDIMLCTIMYYLINKFIIKIKINILYNYKYISFLLITWLYFALFESSKLQSTPGKLFQGIILTDLNGNRTSFIRASIRFFARLLSDSSLFFGHIIIPFTKHKQGLHDLITNTLVLKKDNTNQ